MANANYSVSTTAHASGSIGVNVSAQTTTTFDVQCFVTTSGAGQDEIISCQVFGPLA